MKEKLSLLTVLALLSISLPAQGQSWLGSGTEEDPYLIEDANDMQAIGADPNYWDAHFKLVNDINLAQFTGTQFNIIGNDSNAFTRVFDGNNFRILNFTYAQTGGIDYTGLFGYVDGPNAEIKNLSLTDPNVDAGTGSYVGSLIGWFHGGNITNCCVEGGSVKGFAVTGGLVGCNYGGTISSCHSTCILSGGDADMGGLVGANWSTISNCYATGSVSGRNSESEGIGGLVGDNIGGMISNCYATGNVWGGDGSGGLVGVGEGIISNCYATGKVSAHGNRTGGLMGSYSSYNVFDTISNCYSTGSVDGNDYVGGLVGRNGGTISNCYAVGDVNGINNTGGLIGFDDVGSYTSCFWDSDLNQDVNGIGNTSDPNVIGKTTAEMQQQSTFIGWDFIDVWNIGENQTYPYLRVYLAGDINHDRIVNLFDFAIVADQWLEEQ